jgi:hypothetical protein
LVSALGPDSPAFRRLVPELTALYRRVEDVPEAAVRYREWQSCLAVVYGSPVGDPSLFVRHTYLALIARLIARLFLKPGAIPAGQEALTAIVRGWYFREQGINNFIEDDFFTWPLLPDVAGEGLELVRSLGDTLAAYDFSRAGPDLLQGLYQVLVDPDFRRDLGESCTPRWLTEYLLDEELGLSGGPERSLLDPACGSGAFLSTAIRLITAARLQRGEDPLDVLLLVLDQVMGLDAHPLAVTIARVNCLLALGGLVRRPHPPFLLPVYLSNALLPPDRTGAAGSPGGEAEPVHLVQSGRPGLVFELPDSVAGSLLMLDWLFDRMTNYLAGAQLRAQFQMREDAIRAVLAAFHNYLVAPKPRTPIPDPLSPFAAEVMERTVRRIIELCLDAEDHLWLYILKNQPATVYMVRRKFDLVVGNPPWLPLSGIHDPGYRDRLHDLAMPEYYRPGLQDTGQSSPTDLASLFLARAAELYLKDEGRIALVMPWTALGAQRHSGLSSFSFKGGVWMLKPERVLDMEGVSPLFAGPACVVVARKTARLAPKQAPGEEGSGAARGEPVEPQAGAAAGCPVPGLVLRGALPGRSCSWAEARRVLEVFGVAFN